MDGDFVVLGFHLWILNMCLPGHVLVHGETKIGSMKDRGVGPDAAIVGDCVVIMAVVVGSITNRWRRTRVITTGTSATRDICFVIDGLVGLE